MSLTSKRWKVLPACPASLLNSGVPPLIAQVLYNRGLTDPADFRNFLSCSPSLGHDPLTLPDMHQAVQRIYRALFSGEKMAIFGDFDADGITATVILVEGLEALGGCVVPYLPHRQDEGHGLNISALEELRRSGVSLVITVDCGVSSITEVDWARQRGMDVVITDHHSVARDVPDCVAVVNPKRPDSAYAFRDLAGVGVAFKLLEALLEGTGKKELLSDACSLVAIGTVADMSPLLGENRLLVKQGLDAVAITQRPGLKSLLRTCNISPDSISSNGIGWELAPRLNAAGRIEHAWTGYRLLHCKTDQEADRLAAELDGINKERQALLEEHSTRAREMARERSQDPLIMVDDPSFPAGICGLIAGRLAEEFHRPAIVVQTGGPVVRGSCRSVPEFNIVDALGRCSAMLVQFGGHPAAAGFSIESANFANFRSSLLSDAGPRLAGMDLRPMITIDAEAEPASVAGETYRLMQQMAPFGQGNRSPLFLGKDIELFESRRVGSAGQHLKMRLRCNGYTWQAIGFSLGERQSELPRRVDIAYSAQTNRWNGRESLELNISDLRPAQSA